MERGGKGEKDKNEDEEDSKRGNTESGWIGLFVILA